MSLGKRPDFLLNFSGYKMSAKCHTYRFRSFLLDLDERRLFNNGTPLPLEPKLFDVLVVLVERAGHLVEKEELLQMVWTDSIVEEANVARAVYTLRKVLGENGGGSKFIETVAKKGYRFVAEIEEDLEPHANTASISGGLLSNTAASHTTSIDQIASRGNKALPPVAVPIGRPRIMLFGLGFATAAALLVLLSFNFWPGRSDVRGQRSIAVLPLKPINATVRDELYEVGIAESLIHWLSSVDGFIVRPLSATRKYGDIDQDAVAAGREQQVNYVLASNYQLANGKVRISAQLINVSTGKTEDTYKIESETTDVFSMEDSVAGEVGHNLLAWFGTAEGNRSVKRGTNNDLAYRLYLQGRDLTYNLLPSDTQKAIGKFQEAIRIDPNFAPAYSGLAHAYLASGNLSGGSGEEYTKAKQAVTKALELDADLAEGLAVLGEIEFAIEWNYPAAEKHLRRAIQLESHSDFVHERYAGYLAACGLFDEAVAESKAALNINPLSYTSQRELGRILYLARRYDEAIAQFEQVMEIHHDLGVYGGWLSVSYELNGDIDRAYESFLRLQNKMNPELVDVFRNAYKTSGWAGVRQKRFDLRLNNKQNSTNFYGLARQSAMIGEKELAFEYLNKAIENHQGQLQMLNVEPPFDILRDDPRFDDMVRQVGLKR